MGHLLPNIVLEHIFRGKDRRFILVQLLADVDRGWIVWIWDYHGYLEDRGFSKIEIRRRALSKSPLIMDRDHWAEIWECLMLEKEIDPPFGDIDTLKEPPDEFEPMRDATRTKTKAYLESVYWQSPVFKRGSVWLRSAPLKRTPATKVIPKTPMENTPISSAQSVTLTGPITAPPKQEP